MITEDIAVSWKLHLRGYRIKYEPLAMCWMLVPETLGGLWKQRVRWAQGDTKYYYETFQHNENEKVSFIYFDV